MTTARVLQIGIDPAVVDFSPYPGQDADGLRARIASAESALRDAGFDVVVCQVPDDPDDAETVVRAAVTGPPFDVVEIGSGLRTSDEYSEIFERAVNVVAELQPGIRYCFNDAPESTLDAVLRAVAGAKGAPGPVVDASAAVDTGADVERWEAAVDALWERFDSFERAEGVAAMRDLAQSCPGADGRAAFELAGMCDSMGFEAEAGAAYERALEQGLDDARHARLAVQYGSTLRNLGRLDEAIAVLRAAPTHPSTGSAPRVVLALALHSAGSKDEALRVAIEAVVDTLPRYQRSMRSYAAALTESTGSD